MTERVELIRDGELSNRLVFSDGRVVTCTHDGAPCPRCQTPREYWPKVWEPGFFTLVESGTEGTT